MMKSPRSFLKSPGSGFTVSPPGFSQPRRPGTTPEEQRCCLAIFKGTMGPKWRYPQSSSRFLRDFPWNKPSSYGGNYSYFLLDVYMEISVVNHPAIGVPPWLWKPPYHSLLNVGNGGCWDDDSCEIAHSPMNPRINRNKSYITPISGNHHMDNYPY